MAEKELLCKSRTPKQYSEEDSGWLKSNTDPKKKLSIFALQEQMAETRVWKKIRRLVECNNCSLSGEYRETMHRILSACKKIVGTEYVKWHNNILKGLAVKMGYGKWALPWRYKVVYNKLKTWKSDWKMVRNSPGTGDIQREQTALHVDKT